MNKTAGQLHAAGAPVGGEPDQGAGGFWPPLHSQRHRAVASFLSSCAVTRVLDFGCGEGSLLSYLRTELHVRRMAGMDVDEAALERAVARTEPTLYEHIVKRASPLTVSLHRGSICSPAHVRQLLQHDTTTSAVHVHAPEDEERDAVTLVEVIEHLQPHDLPAMEANVFGQCRPHHVVVTTPNYEFNVVFNNGPLDGPGGHHNKRSKALRTDIVTDQSTPAETAHVAGEAHHDGSVTPASSARQRLPFRHYDHKFEWTRAEFRDWCDSVVSRYGYSYALGGVGTREGWTGRATDAEAEVTKVEAPASESSTVPGETRTPSPKRRPPPAAPDLNDVGFCTQIAYFTRDVGQGEAEPTATAAASTDADQALPPLQLYAVHSFPIDTRSQTEKVAAEVAYAYRYVVCHSEGELDHGDWVSVADRLMTLQAVRELCGASPDRLRAELKAITAGATNSSCYGIEYDQLMDCVRLHSEEEDEDDDNDGDGEGDNSVKEDIELADGDVDQRNQASLWTVAASPGEQGTWGSSWGNAGEDDSAS